MIGIAGKVSCLPFFFDQVPLSKINMEVLMPKKKKEILAAEVKEEKQVEKQPEKKRIFTTNEPISSEKKSKMFTTRDLPTYLPNYHSIKEKKDD